MEGQTEGQTLGTNGQKERRRKDSKVWTESLKEGWTDRSNRRMEDRTEEGKDGWKKMELQTEG